MPANLAVAYNEKLQYVQVRVGDENYILFRGLLPAVAEKCGWSELHRAHRSARKIWPSWNINIRSAIAPGSCSPADFVTSDTGTGFVHIAPGHGLDDYNLGRQNGLPIYSPVDDDGTFRLHE